MAVQYVLPEMSKPPLSRANRITRNSSGFRQTNGNVAAIDFGTTSVSLAYTTTGDDIVNTLTLDKIRQLQRVPNAILINRENKAVISIGFSAQIDYHKMKTADKQKHVYFERLKMMLKREKRISREITVESFTGESYYLVEVIAFILKQVSYLLVDHLSRLAVTSLKTTDFDWVITVPAIWDARGKGMMREAAYLAGLLSGKGISKFTSVAAGQLLPLPKENNPDKLSLALEPEVAAIYSQKHVSSDIDKAGSTAAIPKSKCYMVMDIGGGTVDIAIQTEEKDDSISIISLPTGNAWGGTMVNEKFSKMLQKIVEDDDFKQFLEHGDRKEQIRNRAVLNSILYLEFEEQKITFGEVCDGRGGGIGVGKERIVDLKREFVDFYTEKQLVKGCHLVPGVEYDEGSLSIKYFAMEKELFSEVIHNIMQCSLAALKSVKAMVDTIYLVGGFGGCRYIKGKLQEALQRQLPQVKVNIVVPKSPNLAIAIGAALWRKNPEVVIARRVDATYGLSVTLPFDEESHDSHYKYYSAEEKCDRTHSIYDIFLLEGETAKADEVFTSPILPGSSESTTMTLKIYSTNKKNIQYIKDKSGNMAVEEIGQFTIDIPAEGKPRHERAVDVTMDFSGTEIQAKAKYRVTGEEVKTVCDFLRNE